MKKKVPDRMWKVLSVIKNYKTQEGRVVNIAILRDFNKLVYTHPKYDYYGYKGQGDYQKDEKRKLAL